MSHSYFLFTSTFNVGRSMFNVLFLAWILVSGFSPLQAQQVPETSPTLLEGDTGLRFEKTLTGEKILHWLGRADRTYFIQASPDLLDWTWAPNIESGIDGPMSYEVDGPVTAGFFRLQYTDQTAEDPDSADFDGDGFTNNFELTPRPRPGGIVGFNGLNPNIQTNPLRADTDGDGLNDKWELENGFDPTDDGTRLEDNGPNGDPDNDGVTNLNEQRLGTQPRGNADVTDSDTDGTLDFEDAVPGYNLVSWKRTHESSYALIEIETPSAYPSPEDLNDKGEVLFGDGIWAAGTWIPRQADNLSGADPDQNPYDATPGNWSAFNSERKLIGTTHLTFTDGEPAGGDGLDSIAFWVNGQSTPSLLLDTAELWENVPNNFWPIGVTTDGSMVHLISPEPGTTAYLGRYDPSGEFVGQMTGSDGYQPSGQWHHADVTGTGWVASNLSRPASSGQSFPHKVGLWNASNQTIALPAESNGWGYPVSVKDLPNGKVVLTAGATNGNNTSGRVFLPNPSGQYEYATKLADKNIQLFAGDGSALTSDNKLWRNGELTPLRDLCSGIAELLDQGYSLFFLRSNQRGTYLIQAQGPTGDTRNFVMPAIELYDDRVHRDLHAAATTTPPVPAAGQQPVILAGALVPAGGLAGIAAHQFGPDQNPAASDASDSPAMPELVARIAGNNTTATTNVRWRLRVNYVRGNGERSGATYRLAEDEVFIPARQQTTPTAPLAVAWTAPMAYSAEWRMFQDPGWTAELVARGFFGGDAELFCWIDGQQQPTQPILRFTIGGRNPDDARCKRFIEAQPDAGPQGNLWFSYAIAKSETAGYNGEITRYNQFWEAVRYERRWRMNGQPLFGDDRDRHNNPNGPGGYGLFQVTGTSTNPASNIARRQIWNWQDNVNAGMVILRSKRDVSNGIMQNQRSQAGSVAMPILTVGAVTFQDGTNRTIENASVMKYYNGASRPTVFTTADGAGAATGFVIDPYSSDYYCYWRSKRRIKSANSDNVSEGIVEDVAPAGWALSRINSLGNNYVARVCIEVDP